MSAWNFKAQFAPMIVDRSKRTTIRAYRKDGRDPQNRDTVVVYTGMRTKACVRIGEVLIIAVRKVFILSESISLDGSILSPEDVRKLALSDGFSDARDFFAFFKSPDGFLGLLYEFEYRMGL